MAKHNKLTDEQINDFLEELFTPIPDLLLFALCRILYAEDKFRKYIGDNPKILERLAKVRKEPSFEVIMNKIHNFLHNKNYKE